MGSKWNPLQQSQLEAAYKIYPPVPGASASECRERWQNIASVVDGKTHKQCLKRSERTVKDLQSRGIEVSNILDCEKKPKKFSTSQPQSSDDYEDFEDAVDNSLFTFDVPTLAELETLSLTPDKKPNTPTLQPGPIPKLPVKVSALDLSSANSVGQSHSVRFHFQFQIYFFCTKFCT